MKVRVSIIGASGYTGIELVRLLAVNPAVQLSYLVSETFAEQNVAAVYPHLSNVVQHSFASVDIEQLAWSSDVVFLALPHNKSAVIAKQLLDYSCRVIDLSADFRLNDSALYQEWYQHPAPSAELLEQAVYGLPEIGLREKIASAKLIANPGCYATASILGVAPLLHNQCLELEQQPLIIDAKSGISGAGRSLSLASHFCEAMDNFSAYQVGGIHRHTPEIEQELGKLAHKSVQIQFTPHLIPTPRGLLASVYCRLSGSYSLAQIEQMYREYYARCYFIRISATHQRPGIKTVIGSNFCDISLYLDPRTNYLVVICAIDNLLKGAAGQALQNMNLMFGLPEWSGLQASSSYP